MGCCESSENGCGCDCKRAYGGRGGCLSYFITGNVGNCIMLPVWRAIGRFLRNGFGIATIVATAIIALIVLRNQN
jgi:hypothetical protein